MAQIVTFFEVRNLSDAQKEAIIKQTVRQKKPWSKKATEKAQKRSDTSFNHRHPVFFSIK